MIKLLSLAVVAVLVFDSVKPTDGYGCWTQWFDRDDPSGTGDWETLHDLRKENPGKICSRPYGIEARTLSGRSVSSTREKIFKCDVKTGFICRNKDQKCYRRCSDYKVRFKCPCHVRRLPILHIINKGYVK